MHSEKKTITIKLKEIVSKPIIYGAAQVAVMAILSFTPIWINNKGQLLDYGDYYLQYVPFIEELKRMVASGSLSWSWNSFLGDSFISAYSYYTVFNPFAWLVALFPHELILYGTFFSTVLKISISFVSAFLFIRLFCKKDTSAYIGALLYSFSGFTIVNTSFFFFLDVISVFPFLFYGLELLIRQEKKTAYVLSLCLNAAINYYFFVSTVLAVVLYVFFRLDLYKVSAWRRTITTIIQITVYSILGTGLAGFALLPSFFSILGSGKASESIGRDFLLFYYPQEFLEHLKTLVAPIESGRYHALFDSTSLSSTGLFLPAFGIVGVLQYCLRHRDWLQRICIAFIICFFVPTLNGAFSLYSSAYYTRWLYVVALVFSLMTAALIDETDNLAFLIDKRVLSFVSWFTVCLLFVPTAIYWLYRSGIVLVNRFASACVTDTFIGYTALCIFLVLTFANYSVLFFFTYYKKIQIQQIIAVVSFFCVLNYFTYNAINYDRHDPPYSNQYYYEMTLGQEIDQSPKNFIYRIDYPGQIANYSLFSNMPGVNYYNSIQNPCSSKFADAVGIGNGIQDTVLISSDTFSSYTDALLSVRYYYDYDGTSVIPQGFVYKGSKNDVDIYENMYYIPMGFSYDTYVLEEELDEFEPQQRALVMLQSLVVSSDNEKNVDGILEKAGTVCAYDYSALAAIRSNSTCKSFLGSSRGFEAEFDANKDTIVFFSIPNDPGWLIKVNGDFAKTIEVNYGLLGVYCHQGVNHISARYKPVGIREGLLCSSVSAISFWWLAKRKGKRMH